jgi:uncharacterized repeat protein (TIGR01451 family)
MTMNKTVCISLSLLLSLLLLAPRVQAADGAIRLKNEVFKEVEVTNAKGVKEHKLVEPGRALPKDEMVYITTFSNTGAQPATNIEIINPVPNNSLYKDGSAFGAGTQIMFSVDGGKNYGQPQALRVRGADGQMQPAAAKDYTHIRWIYTNELKPGQESNVMFRTILQ